MFFSSLRVYCVTIIVVIIVIVNGSTVVDISIPPPSFKPVSLFLSRISSILKYPNKSFFNPINIYLNILLHTHSITVFIIILFFVLTFKILFLQHLILQTKKNQPKNFQILYLSTTSMTTLIPETVASTMMDTFTVAGSWKIQMSIVDLV